MKAPKGLTFIEAMVILAIAGLIAAIAVPNFLQARSRAHANECIKNMRQIETAIAQWAFDRGKTDKDRVSMGDLADYIETVPYCPLDSKKTGYILTLVGKDPRCPAETGNPRHRLP